jgi:hypothetical protein
MRHVGRWAIVVTTLWVGGSVRAEEASSVAPPPAPTAPSVPTVLTLNRAAEQGLIVVKGSHPGGYQEVDLHLTSKSKTPLLLDLAGHHLRPSTGNVQRLGLSHPLTPASLTKGSPPGTVPLTLAPGEKVTVRMRTCCMDSGKGTPRPQDEYVIATSATPPKVEAALRWWVDHPGAPQGFVNAAIWQSNLALLEGSWAPALTQPGSEAAGPPMPKGRYVRAYAGIVYTLDDGALTSVDAEGVRRFHATGVWEAWPGADGLLAVGIAADGRDLWRFGETGDPPWMRLFPVREQPSRTVLHAAGGGVLLLQGEGSAGSLWSRSPGKDTPVHYSFGDLDNTSPEAIQAGMPDAGRGHAVVVIRHSGRSRPGALSQSQTNSSPRAPTLEVLDVDVATGKTVPRKKFWNVRQLVPGPAGVFGVSPGNRLVRLDGERFIDLPYASDGLKVLVVGGRRILVTTEGGQLVSVDARAGRGIVLPEGARVAAGVPDASLTVDAKTDQVLWLEGDDVRRWTPGQDEIESIPFR